MGTGKASGKGRARQAALEAISSPLLENMSVVGARGVLCNITGGKNLGLHEISEAASVVYEQAHEDANIIIGSVLDEDLQDEVIVTIIATDFEQPSSMLAEKAEENIVEVIMMQEKVQEQPIIEKTEPIIEPLSLMTKIEDEFLSELKESYVTNNNVQEKNNTFNCAIDSNDLDIPTFMRQK